MQQHIVLDTGRHDRSDTPFCVFLSGLQVDRPVIIAVPGGALVGGSVDLYPSDGGAILVGTIARLDAGCTISISPAGSEADPHSAAVDLLQEQDRIRILAGGSHLTTFHYAPDLPRPFFYPVIGPTGEPVTRSFPMEAPGPDERDDHPHHRSFWVAHGDVNGVDFWSETPGHGVQRVEGTPVCRCGRVSGLLQCSAVWEHNGRPVLADRRTFVFHAPTGGKRVIDVHIEFLAEYGDVTFGDTKEGGLLAFRVAGRMKGTVEGQILNAFGGRGEKECWGAASPWVDYSGPTGRSVQGITIMDHPRNYRYPTRWHVRDYGLFTANPFALSYYKQSWDADGSLTIPSGASLTANYRVVLHTGAGSPSEISAWFTDYLYPPDIRVVDV